MNRIPTFLIAAGLLITPAFAQNATADKPAFSQTAPAPPPATASAPADKPANAQNAAVSPKEAPPAEVKAPDTPKSTEERIAALEAQMAKVIQSLNAIAENAASIDAAKGLARDIVSLQDQIVEIRRAFIPAPKTSAKAPADKPKPATPPKK